MAPYRFVETTYEFGEEIILAGDPTGSWVITNFQYEFFATGPDFDHDRVSVVLRLYKNDGVNGLPGTKIYESRSRKVPPTGEAGYVFEYFDISVAVSQRLTYAIEFTGVSSSSSIKVQSGGLDLYGVPTVGQTFDDYWSRSGAGGTWELRGPTGGEPDINFGALVSGIYSGPPAITHAPQAISVFVGETARFEVVAIGTAPLAYQWLKNGVPIPAATASTFSILYAMSADEGMYSVTVSNGAGSVTSTPVELTVSDDYPKLRIVKAAGNTAIVSWASMFGSPAWSLRQTTSFDAPITWSATAGAVTESSGRRSVTVSTVGPGQLFFRLVKP